MRHARFVFLLCGVVGWGGLALTLARASGSANNGLVSGERIFKGDAPVVAHVSGYGKPLTTEASRCANCHEIGHKGGRPGAESSATEPIGPALSADALTREVARRGGPPSRFDEASFCRLLTSGVDPAHIVVPRTMPRYDISGSQCQDLWQYLTAERS
jgi:hypothetical protein